MPSPAPANPAPDEAPPTAPDSGDNRNSKLKLQKSLRQRNGKVARLPKCLRDQVGRMLDDGHTYSDIIQSLGEHGQNLDQRSIGSWKTGGYKDWLREQHLLEESRFRNELTFNLARDCQGIDNFQAAHKLAAALICQAVADLGPNTLREALKANPLNLLRMLNSLSRLTAGGLKCERYLVDQADRQATLENAKKPGPKKGISPETLQEMKDKLNLM